MPHLQPIQRVQQHANEWNRCDIFKEIIPQGLISLFHYRRKRRTEMNERKFNTILTNSTFD